MLVSKLEKQRIETIKKSNMSTKRSNESEMSSGTALQGVEKFSKKNNSHSKFNLEMRNEKNCKGKHQINCKEMQEYYIDRSIKSKRDIKSANCHKSRNNENYSTFEIAKFDNGLISTNKITCVKDQMQNQISTK